MVEAGNLSGLDNEVVDDLEVFAKDGGKIVVLCAGILMSAFLLGHLLHTRNITWLPESLLVVFLGAIVGIVLPTGNSEVTDWAISVITVKEESLINEMLLNWFLLPMIIFEAGWSLNHKDFVSQFPYILLFAIFGTLISMGIVGTLILQTSQFHDIHEPRVAFAYAALISAVDPVATLATYAHLNVDPLLNTLVFGESVINDAVAIVLFKTLNDMPIEAFSSLSGGELAGRLTMGVLSLLTSSLGLGLLLGVSYILIIRFTGMGHSTSLCAMFIFFSCFFTYNTAESLLGQSGIIAVLFCGMLMGGFATPHLSSEGTLFTSFLLKQMASFADMIVFLFVGTTAVYAGERGIRLGLWVMLFCLLGRATATVPLGLLTNCIKRRVHKTRPNEKKHLLTWKHIFMMCHAGLRGGIALVLTLQLGDWVDATNGPGSREALRNATLIVICCFLAVFGGSTEFTLRKLGIPVGGPSRLEHHAGGQVDGLMKTVKRKFLDPLLIGGELRYDEAQPPEAAETTTPLHVRYPGASPIEDMDQDGDSSGAITTEHSRVSWGDRFSMFGTYDPTHAAEVGLRRKVHLSILRQVNIDRRKEKDRQVSSSSSDASSSDAESS